MEIIKLFSNTINTIPFSVVLLILSMIIFVCIFIYLRRKNPYKAASNHGFVICVIGFFIACIYSFDEYAHFKELTTWNNVADNILSGSIFAILSIIFLRYEELIKNKYEDRAKLTESYKDLITRYSNDNLVIAFNKDKTKVEYPVINLGTGCVTFNNYFNQIIINDNKSERYQLPVILENNFSKLFSVHSTSKVFNSLNIRAKNMSFKNNVLLFETSRTTYFDSLVTNRASDYNFEEGLSVRILYEMGPQMTELESSRLSNHLGFNGFIESADGYIVFVKRSMKMSIGKGTYGDSIGASLKTAYALDEKGVFTVDMLENAIIKEIESELKITEEELDKDTLSIIAIYRDCVECGKPQFLIYAKSNKRADEISTRFKENYSSTKSKTKDGYCTQLTIDQKNLDVLEDGSKLLWIKRSSLKNHIIFSLNSIKYDNKGEEGFVEFSNGKKRNSKVEELVMVPSAIASVVLFNNTINMQVKESYIKSKDDCLENCEDGIFIGEDIIAVVDGCTAKSEFLWDGKHSGLFAKDIICETLSRGVSIDNPESFFDEINKSLKTEIEKYPHCKKEDWPRASLIVYVSSKKEVWSYGDCRCIIAGKFSHLHEKNIDKILSEKRSKIIKEGIKSGRVIEDLIENDFGRKAIENDLIDQFKYENKHFIENGIEMGYPVLNGDEICEDMIKVYSVENGQEVILATDGYPILKNSLKESEQSLMDILKNDPFCYRIYKSTKGLKKGNCSFDDRAYIRFSVIK